MVKVLIMDDSQLRLKSLTKLKTNEKWQGMKQ